MRRGTGGRKGFRRMGAPDTAERRRGRVDDDRGKETAFARSGESSAPAGGGKKSRPLGSADPRRRALRKDGAGSQKSVAREQEAAEVSLGLNLSGQSYFRRPRSKNSSPRAAVSAASSGEPIAGFDSEYTWRFPRN